MASNVFFQMINVISNYACRIQLKRDAVLSSAPGNIVTKQNVLFVLCIVSGKVQGVLMLSAVDKRQEASHAEIHSLHYCQRRVV